MNRRNRQLILVVEDTDMVARLLEALLTRAAWSVAVAPDVDSALAVIAAGKPNLILLDHMLPGENGLAVAAVAVPLGIPIIVLSAFDSNDLRDDYERVGVTMFMRKPFDIHDLLHRVAVVLS